MVAIRILITLALLVSTYLPAQAADLFTPRGIGAGGGLFSPAISDLDPSLQLVASDMSGVFRSVDGGRQWSMIDFKQLRELARSMPPAFFRDVVYWHAQLSLFESRDAGITWARMKWPWKPRRTITGLAAWRHEGEYLLVSTTQDMWRHNVQNGDWEMVLEGNCLPAAVADGKAFVICGNMLLESTDAGATWCQVYDFKDMGTVIGITAGAMGDRSLLLALVNGTGIVRSVDGGRSWEPSAPFDYQGIVQMAPGQVDVAWAVEQKKGIGKKVWRTTDGGRRWESVFRFGGMGGNVHWTWVEEDMRWGYFITTNGFFASRTDPDTALLTTQGDMYRTTNGGKSWHSVVSDRVGTLGDSNIGRYRSIGLEVTTCYQYLFDPWESDRHYAAFTDIGFIRSLDGGTSWSHATKGAPWVNTFYRVRSDPTVPGRLYAAAANRHDIPNWSQLGWSNPRFNVGGPVVSEDYGGTWRVLGTGFPNAPCTDLVVESEASGGVHALYASAFHQGVFKSVDGGETWTDATGNMRRDNLNAFRLWQSPKSGNLYCLVTSFRDKNKIMVPGGLWRSTDRGLTWTELTAGTPMDWLTAFHVDAEERTIYVSVASIPAKKPQVGGIWKSSDGGHTWSRVLDDSRTSDRGFDRMMAVEVHPKDPRIVYAGGFLSGLWYSVDAGSTWKSYAEFPFSSVQSINFDPRDPTRMVLTTFGAGLWEGPALPPSENIAFPSR